MLKDVESSGRQQSEPSSSSSGPSDSTNVMVVEDNEVVGDLLRLLLETEGYRVEVVKDGARAVERVRSARPATVLLDLSLPRVDGREVLHRLKDNPDTSIIPVVVVSAFTDALSASDRKQLSDVVTKPFDVDHLLEAVREAVEERPAG